MTNGMSGDHRSQGGFRISGSRRESKSQTMKFALELPVLESLRGPLAWINVPANASARNCMPPGWNDDGACGADDAAGGISARSNSNTGKARWD